MNQQPQRISQRQFSWMIAVILVSETLLILQHEITNISGNNAWLSYLLPFMSAFVIAWFYSILAYTYPGKNLMDIIQIVVGKWLSYVMIAVIAFYAWILLMRNIRLISMFFKDSLLSTTPEEIIVFIIVLVLIYYGRAGIETAIRVNDMFFSFFFLMIVSFPVILANEIKFNRIEPMLADSPLVLLSSNILGIGWFVDMFLMGAFLHTLSQTKGIQSMMRHGIMLATFLLTLLLFLCILVLGSIMTGQSLYPNYNLFQQIHLTDFLDRVDILLFSIWMPIALLKNIFIYIVFLTTLNYLNPAKLANRHMMNKSAGLFLFFTTLLGFEGLSDLRIMSTYGTLALSLVIQPLFFSVLFTAYLLKKKKNKRHPGYTKAYLFWRRMTFILVGLCFVSIGCGLWLAQDWPKVGFASGIVYALAITLLVFTTNREMNAANEQ